MTTTSKGAKRERELCTILEDAGYTAWTPDNTAYGGNDFMGLFDIMARRQHQLRFIQVKSNVASGINEWFEDISPYYPMPAVTVGYAVCIDRKGWKYAEATSEGYEWVYDERSDPAVDPHRSDCLNTGEGLTEWFSDA